MLCHVPVEEPATQIPTLNALRMQCSAMCPECSPRVQESSRDHYCVLGRGGRARILLSPESRTVHTSTAALTTISSGIMWRVAAAVVPNPFMAVTEIGP